jgi:hypothetical protein
MKLMSVIPLLLSVLVGLVLGLMAWNILRLRRRAADDGPVDTGNGLLLGLLILGAVALGMFLTYVLVGLGG